MRTSINKANPPQIIIRKSRNNIETDPQTAALYTVENQTHKHCTTLYAVRGFDFLHLKKQAYLTVKLASFPFVPPPPSLVGAYYLHPPHRRTCHTFT